MGKESQIKKLLDIHAPQFNGKFTETTCACESSRLFGQVMYTFILDLCKSYQFKMLAFGICMYFEAFF